MTVLQNVWESSYERAYRLCDHVSARSIGKKDVKDKKTLNTGLRLEIRVEKEKNVKDEKTLNMGLRLERRVEKRENAKTC